MDVSGGFCSSWLTVWRRENEKTLTPASEQIRWRCGVVVCGWKSGEFLVHRAVALGVRVGRENVERFFDKDWDIVLIKMESETIPVRITKAFWTTLPEL